MGAGCRVAPNASKMFYRWGMEQRLRQCAVKSKGVLFAQCVSPFEARERDDED